MRKIAVEAKGFPPRTIIRVTSIEGLPTEWGTDLEFLIRATSGDNVKRLKTLRSVGLSNVSLLTNSQQFFDDWAGRAVLDQTGLLDEGDVVAVGGDVPYAHVLMRETDRHHTVFLTNRCNSNCLMCSQPPTLQDDSWLIDEARKVASHMRFSPALLGFTGGEPLLLGQRFRELLEVFIARHPTTEFDVLTNGRLLASKPYAKELLDGLVKRVTWMVPLYGHADFLHDFIVQSHGAFDETLQGILHLHHWKQPIQLRTVLVRPVLEVLPRFTEFVGKNLPFVREVALMGCEPIGFALANRDITDVDLREWHRELIDGIKALERLGVRPILLNTPLCSLPPLLWKYAQQSISDWKNTFEPECDTCVVKESCSGLFSWHTKNYASKVHRIEGVVNV